MAAQGYRGGGDHGGCLKTVKPVPAVLKKWIQVVIRLPQLKADSAKSELYCDLYGGQ